MISLENIFRRCVHACGWDSHVLWDLIGLIWKYYIIKNEPVAEKKSCMHVVLKRLTTRL